MINQFVVRLDGQKIDELLLKRDSISIGRKVDNDLRLEDTTVSSHHALIRRQGQDVYIQDCGSTNGTFVNGEPVQQAKLKDRDVIIIGKYTIENCLIEVEPLTMELDPTQQISKQDFKRILARINQDTDISETSGISRKTLNWIAQDESGVWWGFENQPVQGLNGWIDEQEGAKILLKQEMESNQYWRDTLQKL